MGTCGTEPSRGKLTRSGPHVLQPLGTFGASRQRQRARELCRTVTHRPTTQTCLVGLTRFAGARRWLRRTEYAPFRGSGTSPPAISRRSTEPHRHVWRIPEGPNTSLPLNSTALVTSSLAQPVSLSEVLFGPALQAPAITTKLLVQQRSASTHAVEPCRRPRSRSHSHWNVLTYHVVYGARCKANSDVQERQTVSLRGGLEVARNVLATNLLACALKCQRLAAKLRH